MTEREGDRIKEREEEKSETHTIDSETERKRERENEKESAYHTSLSKFNRISHACVLIAKVHHRHVGERKREREVGGGGWRE